MILIYPLIAAALLMFESKPNEPEDLQGGRRVLHNFYTAPWNGLGAVEGTIQKTADAPMVYRVLVPWVIALIEKVVNDPPKRVVPRLTLYLLVKWGLMTVSLVTVHLILGPVFALGAALYWLMTVQFDYWSLYAETMAFAMVLSGQTELAVIGVIIAAMSRETSFVLPVIFAFVVPTSMWPNMVLVFSVWIATVASVREYQGKHDLYCARVMVLENLDMNETLRQPHRRYYLAVGWGMILLSVLILFHTLPEPFNSTKWVPVVISALGFGAGFVHEPRIFTVSMLWYVAWLGGM